ncbi:MAG: chromate efflux transporter [Phocaeicola sp.]|uniref:chromate efflux transporter n=1 Tax=Phocaeicola TaxID=909656 RepID=UPI00234F85A8|nr:chromate efflux transporter [Phocaeicola oris]MCE2616140.1 chromate efflux transporter [Phocaeicola oris]
MKNGILYIFLTFLKLGSTAFGGYMSLIAIVQRQIVEIDKKMKEEDLLDGISLVSVLPGPMAVNLIAYVGYRLKGLSGAFAAFIAIIIPSFFLVLFLSWFYFNYGNVPQVKSIFQGFLPMIVALIFTVALNMAKKQLKVSSQWVIGIISALLLVLVGGFWLTFAIIVLSGLIGYFLFRENKPILNSDIDFHISKNPIFAFFSIIVSFLSLVFVGGAMNSSPNLIKIVSIFGGSSLTLFGGGYVVIPTLRELFVGNLGWLTDSQFADGIAIGQVTPGPIFITSAFIGYKVAGFLGALMATIAMFTPPAVLTVICARFFMPLTKLSAVKAIMKGVRASVIGMIFASTFTIGKTMDFSIPTFALLAIYLIVTYKFKMSPVYLILGSGIAGLLLF